MPTLDRRHFLEFLATLGFGSLIEPASSSSLVDEASLDLSPGTYRPGRIDNEYSLFTAGEEQALQAPPTVSAIESGALAARLRDQSLHMRPNDQLDGWRLLTIFTLDGVETAVFEKHVSCRGAIAYVKEREGVVAYIPKHIGQLSNIRPRPTNTPHGVRFERLSRFGPDTAGNYILNSAEDPCFENVAALGPEYVGWTLVANEEGGPRTSLYLEASGKSRQLKPSAELQASWAPDAFDRLFDPAELIFQDPADGYSSKRTLLGGYLPVADIAIWSQVEHSGFEVIVLLPPGADAQPMARLRGTLTPELQASLNEFKDSHPEFTAGLTFTEDNGVPCIERYWNSSAQQFHGALLGLWNKWRSFHEDALQVDIPDQWLLNAARAGLTLARCSYTGLDPTYQIGEGSYTKVPPSSHALFPVAHYEFIWAHQLWNHGTSADTYFQHYLDHYVLPDGNFLYNIQEQVEAPLNIGLFLANSARSYFYSGDVVNLEKRLPVLERMIEYVLKRYEYSKTTFPSDDRRHGLIWGSPEADLGDPKKDTPADHPFFYQNSVCIWRGLHEHAKALAAAGQKSGRKAWSNSAEHYRTIAHQMRMEIEASLAATLGLRNSVMRTADITPFTPDDIDRDPMKLESYENHRFMEDWFLADWGDATLDQGHLRHRTLAGMQSLGLGTSGAPFMTSNFMAHGTLSVLIRQEDYRPFLLSLYALTCYAADCGNRYAPEDAYIPGGHPLEGSPSTWSAVVNSTLQPTLGLRWLLCYEETDHAVCHLQKAAPKHWFAQGQTIKVKNCPTRFGTVSWSTRAIANREWQISLNVPKDFAADLVIHIHPGDDRRLRTTSSGILRGNQVVLRNGSFGGATEHTIRVS
jgi:hypothetical protein